MAKIREGRLKIAPEPVSGLRLSLERLLQCPCADPYLRCLFSEPTTCCLRGGFPFADERAGVAVQPGHRLRGHGQGGCEAVLQCQQGGGEPSGPGPTSSEAGACAKRAHLSDHLRTYPSTLVPDSTPGVATRRDCPPCILVEWKPYFLHSSRWWLVCELQHLAPPASSSIFTCFVPYRVLVSCCQVLVNGVTNALKHTDSGTVQIHVSLLFLGAGSRRCGRNEPADTTACLLLVVDACRGMPTQVCNTTMPDGQAGLLFQVIDTGHGLGGKDFQRLFDPLQEMGMLPTKPVALSIHEACAEVDVVGLETLGSLSRLRGTSPSSCFCWVTPVGGGGRFLAMLRSRSCLWCVVPWCALARQIGARLCPHQPWLRLGPCCSTTTSKPCCLLGTSGHRSRRPPEDSCPPRTWKPTWCVPRGHVLAGLWPCACRPVVVCCRPVFMSSQACGRVLAGLWSCGGILCCRAPFPKHATHGHPPPLLQCFTGCRWT